MIIKLKCIPSIASIIVFQIGINFWCLWNSFSYANDKTLSSVCLMIKFQKCEKKKKKSEILKVVWLNFLLWLTVVHFCFNFYFIRFFFVHSFIIQIKKLQLIRFNFCFKKLFKICYLNCLDYALIYLNY